MSQSICWHCLRQHDCRHSRVTGTIGCSFYESIAIDSQTERIAALERELAESKASLARDRERWQAEAEALQAKLAALEQVTLAALGAQGQARVAE